MVRSTNSSITTSGRSRSRSVGSIRWPAKYTTRLTVESQRLVGNPRHLRVDRTFGPGLLHPQRLGDPVAFTVNFAAAVADGAVFIGDLGGVQQRLGRDAAHVEAGAADVALLDHADRQAHEMPSA